MEANKRYLSRAEAARYTGISKTALAVLAGKNSGPIFSKLNPGKTGKVIYDIVDLDAFIESHKVNVNM